MKDRSGNGPLRYAPKRWMYRGGRPHIPVRRTAPAGDFERVAAGYPVFRIDSPSPRRSG